MKINLQNCDIDKMRLERIVKILLQNNIITKSPINDAVYAMSLFDVIKTDGYQGYSLHRSVTDGINGYGTLDEWYGTYSVYYERCIRCMDEGRTEPHTGNHRWRKGWRQIFTFSGASIEELACRFALKYHLMKPEKIPIYEFIPQH